ncbi:alkylation response protein AidB-like acyl-CoA dehydrogenase [Actinocorallia herbida]|uniref:Alkylation response protein AidB-like acyl-CoA dehydrogenase n=1 Tax=Actinocorallia herbida TaxID=58109 RepID=A0A3N1CUM4_9ACTN|nr:acyl-CoA dehydrogenase family protein [Actinocorallia herbida]ROO84967.1 alkylation response protein AidB-like acyl-CoA dehydrogenase [Actinocorallia herbida]
MDLAFSDEQEELRGVVRAFLGEHATEAELRRHLDGAAGYDPAGWARMAGQLGLQGLAVPEEFGGSGAGPVETGIVLEEMGRALYSGPYLSAVLAVRALLAAGDAGAAAELLPGIASGSTVAAVAFGEGAPGVSAEDGPDGPVLHGVKDLVPDGGRAGLVLVTASGADGLGLYAVRGFTAVPLRTLDATRPLARLEFAGVPARRIGGDAARIVEDVLVHARAALAAEAVGGAAFLLDRTVAHVRDRVQFGEPIGSFQAVQHACAQMYVEVESARAAAHHALLAAAAGSPEAPLAASLAKAYCADAFIRVATEAIQLHGGIGVTWEHPAHLYFRRAQGVQALFGSSDRHRDDLVDRLATSGRAS